MEIKTSFISLRRRQKKGKWKKKKKKETKQIARPQNAPAVEFSILHPFPRLRSDRQPVAALSSHLQKLFVWWTGCRSASFILTSASSLCQAHKRPKRVFCLCVRHSNENKHLYFEHSSVWLLWIELNVELFLCPASTLREGQRALFISQLSQPLHQLGLRVRLFTRDGCKLKNFDSIQPSAPRRKHKNPPEPLEWRHVTSS